MTDHVIVWTYSNSLEKESPRFSQPGDFFVYIVFLGVFILVSIAAFLIYLRAFFPVKTFTHEFFRDLFAAQTSHYLPVQPTSS